ncbi:MAG: hypothetical protein MI919_30800, partial [Holophagales bacterium]|nr:hypothetical protein [Holophagales bacterium]
MTLNPKTGTHEVLRPVAPLFPRHESSRAKSFEEVQDDELDAIRKSRQLRLGLDDEPPPFDGGDAAERASNARLSALAFSGGGIRSATFNLGVAQGLARRNLLRRFDYLSINSGGSYIGSWLLAWIRRDGLRKVEQELTHAADNAARDRNPEASQISFLRRFSNYLTPKIGAFSADTWTMVATYLRNFLLNLIILVMALGAILSLVRLLLVASGGLKSNEPWHLLLGALLVLAVGVAFLGRNQFLILQEGDEPARQFPWFTSQSAVQLTVVLPLFAAAWL